MKRIYEYDVAVVGGGTGGVAAACGAARAGANCVIIERGPCFGGNATLGGITALCGVYTCGANAIKVVDGVLDEIVSTIEEVGGHIKTIISATGNKNLHFNSEYLKYALDLCVERAGVTALLDTRVIAAKTEGTRITEITCVDDVGQFTVRAKTFIDTTGHGNLAHMAGAETVMGDDEGQVQAVCMAFRMEGVDLSEDTSPLAVEAAVKAGKAAGIPFMGREKGFILPNDDSKDVTVLLANFMINPDLSSANLTQIEQEGRRQVISYAKALKTYMPAMKNANLLASGPAIAFRESRRLVGKETLTSEATLKRIHRADSVARGGWKPEIHKSTVQMATYLEVPEGTYFDISIGMLQSANISNLYGAGRFISCDPGAFAAVRIIGSCLATGQAAGVAAALQACSDICDIDRIRAELKRQGAQI